MKRTVFAPGRTELAGNHTDHQKGRILASAVDLGLYAETEANGTDLINISSGGYDPFEVNLKKLTVNPSEFGSSKSLVRGVAAGFKDLGLKTGGFDAVIRSTLPAGSGLSSSAAFSVLIGNIFSELFNDSSVDRVVIARPSSESPADSWTSSPVRLDIQSMLISPPTK